MGTVAANSVVCPRCGYDLRGQVDTWRVPLATQADVVRFESGEVLESEVGAKCPVEGTCSECGLGFEWKYVFRPELAGPAWFVETRRVGRVRAFVGTVWRVLILWPFFRSPGGVKIETSKRWARVAWYVAMWVAILPAIQFIFRLIWGVIFMWLRMATPLDKAALTVIKSAPTDLIIIITKLRLFGGRNWFFVGVTCSLGFAAMMMVLPYTRAKAKVRESHVVRAAAYSITWLAIPVLLETLASTLDGAASLFPAATRRMSATFDVRHFLHEVAAGLWSQEFRTLLIVATAIWCYVYWWQVIRKWWRMEEAAVAYVACSVPVAMMAITAIVYNYP